MKLFWINHGKGDKRVIPADKVTAYSVSEDNKLTLKFKETAFKDRTKVCVYQYSSKQALEEELNKLVEWIGK